MLAPPPLHAQQYSEELTVFMYSNDKRYLASQEQQGRHWTGHVAVDDADLLESDSEDEMCVAARDRHSGFPPPLEPSTGPCDPG